MECNELYHHGIKGQRWGIRRYQNEDGSLTSLGRKREQSGQNGTDNSGHMSARDAKKWYKKNRSEVVSKQSEFEDEFDETESGKKMKRNYEKQINRMYSDNDWDDNPQKQKEFNAAEESYLRKQAEYAAKKLIETYGNEKVSIYASRGKIQSGKSAMELISDQWWTHAV